MSIMDFLPSDLEQMNTNFLDMIENDVNSQILDIENLNSDKLNDILNGDGLQDSLNGQMDYSEMEDVNNSNWFQSLQWNDSSKVPQSLIDASNEVENNNPNLLVNPQSVLPVHSTHAPVLNTTQQMNHLNTRNAIAVKINGQDAVLTPTQHPQIQYVTVQNATINSSPLGYTVQPITLCQQQLQNVHTITSPSLTSPVLVEHLQNGIQDARVLNNNNKVHVQQKKPEKVYPKPVYSYSCLIAMALKNSKTGNLPVSEIYNFMIDNFPYFKTAPDGWKNSVRHNLSLNKCFAKVESNKPAGQHTRKGCLWALNPAKVEKMEDEIVKWRKKDPESVRLSMSKPENLELIEQGKAGPPRESDDPMTPIKQEPMSPAKPVGRPATVSQICQTPADPAVIKRESAVMVKMDGDNIKVSSMNPFDPALSDLALQNGVWEDELTIAVGNPQTTLSTGVAQNPSGTTVGTQYHGNITYTCASPMQNTTPTKLYPPTPTKIYPSTPSRVILA